MRINSLGISWGGLLFAWTLIAWLGDPYAASLWHTTLSLGFCTAAIATPLGGLLAWLVIRSGARGKYLAVSLVGAWALMPLYVQAASWKAVLDPVLSHIDPKLLSQESIGFIRAWCAHAFGAVPWSTFVFMLAWHYLPRGWEEQVRLHSKRTVFLIRATWPYWVGASAVTVTWSVLAAATDITATDLFQVRTISEAIYLQFALGDITNSPSAMWESALFVICLTGIVASSISLVLAPVSEPTEVFGAANEHRSKSWFATAALWCLLTGMVGIPVLTLTQQIGLEVLDSDQGRTTHYSLTKTVGMLTGLGPYGRDFVGRQFQMEWWWSVVISTIAAATTTILASMTAWWGAATRRRGFILATVLAAAWAVPGPQWGIWISTWFTFTDWGWLLYLYDQTVLAPVIAGVIHAFPLATLILWGGFRLLPPSLTDTARLAGWGFFRQWLFLGIPVRRMLIGVVGITSAALVFSDVAATLPVIPPGILTISVRIFDLLHAGVDDVVAGICLFLSGIVTISLFAAWALLSRVTNRPRPGSKDRPKTSW